MKCWAPNRRDLMPWPTGSGHTPGAEPNDPPTDQITLWLETESLRVIRKRAATNKTSLSEEARRIVERGLRAK